MHGRFGVSSFIAVLLGMHQVSLAYGFRNLSHAGGGGALPHVIQLDSLTGRNTEFNAAPQFFFAYQNIDRFRLSTPLTEFIKVPGLSLVFYHTQPRLYKIRFEGHIHTPVSGAGNFARIMIDNYLLISNKLYPNSADRLKSKLPKGSHDMTTLDWRGGVFTYCVGSINTFPCSKTENVYLPGGTHSIEVVIRTGGVIQVEGFELCVETVELPSTSRTNLPLLFPSDD